jgi:uncharacterized YigZ family protein
MTEYYVPTGPGDAEYVEKRSKFLGKVRPVECEEDARAFIEEMKKKYHDARHNCWCYTLRDGVLRYSDDGEPQGTAGQPMLEVFNRVGVTNAVCVITRYFGGVLLGAGPLLRAYQGTAKLALEAAGISVVRRWVELTIPCGYNLLGKITQEIPAWDGIVADTEYGAEVVIKALLPEGREAEFIHRVLDLSSGAAQPSITGDSLKAVPVK